MVSFLNLTQSFEYIVTNSFASSEYRPFYIILHSIFFFLLFEISVYLINQIIHFKNQPIKWLYFGFSIIFLNVLGNSLALFGIIFYFPDQFNINHVVQMLILSFCCTFFVFSLIFNIIAEKINYHKHWSLTILIIIVFVILIFSIKFSQLLIILKIFAVIMLSSPIIIAFLISLRLGPSFKKTTGILTINTLLFYSSYLSYLELAQFIDWTPRSIIILLIIRIISLQTIAYYSQKQNILGEIRWQNSITEIFVLDKLNKKIVFAWHNNPESKKDDSEQKSALPKGLLGIDDLVKSSLLIKAQNGISFLQEENKYFFLEHTPTHMFCVITTKNLWSHKLFIKLVQGYFERFYKTSLAKIQANSMSAEENLAGFEKVIAHIFTYTIDDFFKEESIS